MSLDEARSNYSIDAGNNISTNNYLLVGDNAYSYSYAGTDLNFGIIGDLDTYFAILQPGHSYTVVILQEGLTGSRPLDADFALLDRYGNVLTLSVDYGSYSAYTFIAVDSLYYIQAYTSTPGYTTLRLENNTIRESNGIGETIVPGRSYPAALDYVSDVDIYNFYASAGVTYEFGIVSSISDIYLDIEYFQMHVDSLVSFGGGIYTFTAPSTGFYELHISSNSFTKTGSYTLYTDITPPTIAISTNDSSLTVGETATITFTLSEASTNFIASDVTVSGGTLTNFTGSGTSYFATFTPTSNSTTNGVVSVASGNFTDAAGNINTDGGDANNTVTMTVNTVAADTTPPTVNQVQGGDGDDLLSGGAGDDRIDGGSGIDTAVYSSSRSQYTVSKSGSSFTVSSSAEDTDTLVNIERLRFTDSNVALDVSPTGNAGEARLFIGTIAHGLIDDPGVVGTILYFFDQDLSMQQLFQMAIDVNLISDLAGSSSNDDLARLIWRNVVGTEAGPEGVDLLLSFMDGRNASFSQAQLLTAVSQLEINQTHVDLVGLASTGLAYLPFSG